MDGPTFAVHISLEAAAFETTASSVSEAATGMAGAFGDAAAGIEALNAWIPALTGELDGLLALLSSISGATIPFSAALEGVATAAAVLAPAVATAVGILGAAIPEADAVAVVFSRLAISVGETVTALLALAPAAAAATTALIALAVAQNVVGVTAGGGGGGRGGGAAGGVNQLAQAFGAAGRAGGSFQTGMQAVAITNLVTKFAVFLPIILSITVALGALYVGFKAFEFLKSSIEDAAKFQVVVGQLNTVLHSTGAAAGYSAQQLIDHATALETVTGRSKEEIVSGETILTRFTKIGHDVFPQATQAALDLAQKTGDVSGSFTKVGKVLEGSAQGFRTLTDLGIVLTAKQKAAELQLLETGNIAKYQADILNLLSKATEGAAAAFAVTFLGGVANAKHMLDDFTMTLGSQILPALDTLMSDLIDSAGGWKNIQKWVKETAESVGTNIAFMVYNVELKYHEMVFSQEAAISDIAEGLGRMVEATGDALSNITSMFAKVPAIFGGGEIWNVATEQINEYRRDVTGALDVIAEEATASANKQVAAIVKIGIAMATNKPTNLGNTNVEPGRTDAEIEGIKKRQAALENYRLQVEKLIQQSALKVAAEARDYQAQSMGTVALEAARVATARLAAEEKAREVNAAAASKGLAVNADLPKILGDSAAATELWKISIDHLKTAQGDLESATSSLIAPLDQLLLQLQYLDVSKTLTVGISPEAITSATDWGKAMTTATLGVAALSRGLFQITAFSPQWVAMTNELSDAQSALDAMWASAVTQLAIYQEKLEEPANTATANAQLEIKLTRDRITATKAGTVELATYDIRLAAHNEALKVQESLIQQVGETDIAFATRRTQVYIQAFNAMDTETQIALAKTDNYLTQVASVFDIMSNAFGGATTKMGQFAAGMSKLVVAIKAVADAQGAANKVMAAAGAGAALQQVLQGLNVGGSNKTGGSSALGGQLEGNYAGVGSLVGTIIGGIIGAVVSEGAATGAGAALGAAIGTVVGSLISKAGDSASAHLTSSGNAIIGETSNQLNGAVKDALTNIFKGIETEMAKLGILLQGIPLIDIKVRDNIIRVIVGNVTRTFSSMQDAISFAISQAVEQLATGGGGHLPPEVLAALKNTTATDLASLQSDIDFATTIANVGVPKVVQAINSAVSDFFVNMQRAVSLGISTVNVIAQFAQQIQAQKDAILQTPGKSPAEQMRADAAAFNQRMELLKAQEQADIADLDFKKADLQAKIAIARAEMQVGLSADKAQLDALGDMEAALSQIETAIAAANGVIASIVEISDKELAAALARLGKGSGGAGGSGSTPLDTLLGMIKDINWQTSISGMDDFEQKIAEINKKWADASAAVNLHSNALAEATKQHEAAIKAANGNKDAIAAANAAYAKETANIAKTQAALEAANAARLQEIELLKKDLDARIKTFEDAANPGTGLTSAMTAISDQAEGLMNDARDLQKQTHSSLTDLHALVRAIGDAERAQQQALVQKADTDLLGELYGILGMDHEAAVLKYNLAVAELNMKRQEIALSLQTLHYTAEATHAILDPLDALISKVIAGGPALFGDKPDVNTPGGDGNGGHWVYNPQTKGWVWVPDATDGSGGTSDVDAANAKIQGYLDLVLSPFQRSLKALNAEFDNYRKVLGNTAEVQQAYALALHDLVTQQLQGLKDYLDGMLTSTDSPLKPEDQLALVQQQIAAAFALAQGGDASQGDILAKLVQQALQLAQQVDPVAGSAYRDLFASLNAMLQQVWAMFNGGHPLAPPAAGTIPNTAGLTLLNGGLSPPPGPSGIIAGDTGAGRLVLDFAPVITQMQLSTTMLQGSLGRVEDQTRRGADASVAMAAILKDNCSLYRKVS